MNMLGDVTDGWFAQLAHGAEALSTGVINMVSPGGGERFYKNMDDAAQQHVSTINEKAIKAARDAGASEQKALQAGSERMDQLINPKTFSQLGSLIGESRIVSGDALAKSVKSEHPFDLGMLTPLLIGSAVVGGVYLGADLF